MKLRFSNLRQNQLLWLFLAQFVIVFTGNGLFPVLPMFAARFDAGATVTGIFLALIFAALALGAFVPGWLASIPAGRRLGLRAQFVLAALAGVPALALIGQAAAFWQVVALAAVVWFVAGIVLALIAVLTGLAAPGGARGKAFGLLGLTPPLGALLGGAAVGGLVANLGYGAMFAFLGGFWSLVALVGAFALRFPASAPQARDAQSRRPGRAPAPLGAAFFVLVASALLIAVGVNTGRLGTTLAMQDLGYRPGAVAGATSFAGLVAAPLTLWMGALSDRLGRRQFLVGSALLAAAGVLVLVFAGQLWHFWLSAALIMAAMAINGALAAAYAADLLTPAALGRGLPLLHGATSAAAVISFAASGPLGEAFGLVALFGLAAGLSVLAAALLEVQPVLDRLPQRLRRLAPGLQSRPRPGEC